MPSTHVYTNQASTLREFEGECVSFDAAGYVVDFGQAWWECSPASVAALDRPRMQQLLRRLRAGDLVATLRLCSLGSSVRDVVATVERFRSLGVKLHCVETGEAMLTDAASVAFRTLQAVEGLEHDTRSARMKASAEQAVERGSRLGRRPALATDMHDEIRAALRCGASVSELARTFKVSRQTIMRIRDVHAE
ncbi:recombinase family protein [Cupriavidus pauculus]|nr:recombinase family protein [Cupriavidus pauculus]